MKQGKRFLQILGRPESRKELTWKISGASYLLSGLEVYTYVVVPQEGNLLASFPRYGFGPPKGGMEDQNEGTIGKVDPGI